MMTITFISQFPPPIHGLSKAVETLYNSELRKKYHFRKIDITNNKSILKNVLLILFSRSDLFYFTIAQTKGGNLRDLMILALLRLKRAKVLVHLHGGYYRTLIDRDCAKWQRELNYKAIAKVEGCIVLGESLRLIFEGMIDVDKIYIVPNCVDDEFRLAESDYQEKISLIRRDEKVHILYLSNFIRAKGYRETLELAFLAKQSGNDSFVFHFAGKFYDQEEEVFFFNYIEENDLVNLVVYHGIVSGDEKKALLKLSTVFTLLTNYPNEGQPISILEAMGNAMAIITTDHAGIPDIVKNGENGLIVSKIAINVTQIYKQLLDWSLNSAIHKEICLLNYDLSSGLFTQERYINNMDSVFTKVLYEQS